MKLHFWDTAPTIYANLDPRLAITQCRQDAWGTDAGLPADTILGIAQTSDGYLWLAAEEGSGPVFDGVEFTDFDLENTVNPQANEALPCWPSWLVSASRLKAFQAS